MWHRIFCASVAVILLGAACSCGDDDGGGAADAGLADAPAPPDADPFDECPGELELEAEMQDLLTDMNLFEVRVEDANEPSNFTTSAPNGRAVLCLPLTGVHQIRATRADLLPHLQTVDSQATLLHRPLAVAYEMLSEADADTFVAGLGGPARDPTATQLFVAVRSEPGGTPLTGAQVSLVDEGDGAYVRDESGDFVPGNTLGTDATVLFANVPVDSDPIITLTLPGGQTCNGPTTISAEAGLSSVFFSCQ